MMRWARGAHLSDVPEVRTLKPLAQFGLRKMADGAIRNQPWCRTCRSGAGTKKPKGKAAEATAEAPGSAAEEATAALQVVAAEAKLPSPRSPRALADEGPEDEEPRPRPLRPRPKAERLTGPISSEVGVTSNLPKGSARRHRERRRPAGRVSPRARASSAASSASTSVTIRTQASGAFAAGAPGRCSRAGRIDVPGAVAGEPRELAAANGAPSMREIQLQQQREPRLGHLDGHHLVAAAVERHARPQPSQRPRPGAAALGLALSRSATQPPSSALSSAAGAPARRPCAPSRPGPRDGCP